LKRDNWSIQGYEEIDINGLGVNRKCVSWGITFSVRLMKFSREGIDQTAVERCYGCSDI